MSAKRPEGPDRGRGPGPFARLGRFIVGHAKLVVLLWVLFLVVSLPLLPRISSATTSSALTLPSSAPSAQESQQASRVFPNSTISADTLLLLSGPNITGPEGRNATLALTRAIDADPSIHRYATVETLYTAYQAYLEANRTAVLEVLREGFNGTYSVFNAVNGTAQLLWGSAGLYLFNFQNLVLTDPFVNWSTYNYPAYQETLANASIASEPAAVQNLTLFYCGDPGASCHGGWNASNGCWSLGFNPTAILGCSDRLVRSLHNDTVLAGLKGGGPLDPEVLQQLDLQNFTKTPCVQNTTVHILALSSGVPFPQLNSTWKADPQLNTSAYTIDNESAAYVADHTAATYVPAVPPALLREFVDVPADNVTVLLLGLNVSDSSPQAQTVVSELDRITPLTLSWSAPSGKIDWVQTGDAALVVTEANVINQDTDAILPITVVLLLAITGLYFRAPWTPAVVLITVGLALLLGLAAMVISSDLTGRVTQTALTLLVTFSLGVGTDYSVFLMARYREELWNGRPHEEALLSAVTWAGESIATSGSTVVLATLAMTFSGASLISDWGKVLSAGVTIAVLVALTLVPAVLYLVGPRIFWPYTGERFERQARRRREQIRGRSTYFHRASRFSTRHPAVVLTLLAMLTLPLVYLALTAPLSYSYFDQLPPTVAPERGLNLLSGNFGPGYVFPLSILVNFSQPLVPGCPSSPGTVCVPTSVDAGELAQAAYVAQAINQTEGVRSVSSLFGLGGAPLGSWLNLTRTPAVPEAALLATFSSYVGDDGRTVAYTVALDVNGNSNQAVQEMNAIEANLSGYAQGHRAISAIYYGGATSITKDLQAELAQSSERMELIIVVGLVLILLLALGSASLPPLALITIAISAAWSWALTYGVFVLGLTLSLFFYIPPVLFLLIMGLGMDYNIFILTRIREERLKGHPPRRAVVDAVAHTAGIITAAAIILGGAFFALVAAQVTLLRVLGFAVGAAVILDAAVVRTYLVPAILGASGDRIWWAPGPLRRLRRSPADVPIRLPRKKGPAPSSTPVAPGPSGPTGPKARAEGGSSPDLPTESAGRQGNESP